LKRALAAAAAEDHRPVASYVEKLLIEHLKKKGYLKTQARRHPIDVFRHGRACPGHPRLSG